VAPFCYTEGTPRQLTVLLLCGDVGRPRAVEPGSKPPPAKARAKVKAKPRAAAAPVALTLFVGEGVEISITASDLSTVNQAVVVSCASCASCARLPAVLRLPCAAA
jgi:hypothetical protein